MWGGLKSTPHSVTRIPLESGNAVEAGIGGKSLDVSKLVQSSIGIDGEDADDSDPGLEVEEILAIAAEFGVA